MGEDEAQEKTEQEKNKAIKNIVYTVMLYIVFPILVSLLVFALKTPIKNALSGIRVGGGIVENSNDGMEQIIEPFVSMILFLISFAVVLIGTAILRRICEKGSLSFNAKAAKQFVFYIGVIAAILSFIVVIYAKAEGFQYQNYGISIENTDSLYIPLQKIPSIGKSVITSPQAPWYYNLFIGLAQFNKFIFDNIDRYLSILSVLIIPINLRLHVQER